MGNGLQTQAEQYRKHHKRRRIWQRIVSFMACIVVFCTVYALILPAITMEQPTFCGMETHEHTEECFEKRLICGSEAPPAETEEPPPEATAHVHGEECYEERQVCVCTLEESAGHVHTEDCIRREETLTCTEDHEHTEACVTVMEQYVCGLAVGEGVHTHLPECYETQRVLICGNPEPDTQAQPLSDEPEATEGHVHGEECYGETLICELEEHIHSLACYSDPQADLEPAYVWEQSMAGVKLTGNWADDLIAIAESQLGYSASSRNYKVMPDGETIKGVTRYGRWYGDAYGDWCAMFVSFCLHYSDIPETAVPYEAACQRWVDALSVPELDLYRPAEGYRPVKGDLIFFDWDADDEAEHVGIVREVGEQTLITIEGNSGNCVRRNEYELDDERILGFGALPENPDPPALEDGTRTLTAEILGENTEEASTEEGTILVTGVLPEDARAVARPVTVETEKQILCAYEIKLYQGDGSPLIPEEGAAVTVSISSPAFAALDAGMVPQVYRIPENGEPEAVTTVRGDGQARFPYFDGTCLVAAVPREEATETISLSGEYLYENDRFSLILQVTGEARIPESGEPAEENETGATEPESAVLTEDGAGEPEAPEAESPVLRVTEMEDQAPEYRRFADGLETGELVDLSVLSLEFLYEGRTLDLSGCSVTARIVPRDALMESAQAACTALEAQAAPEAETGVEFTVLGATAAGTEELDSALVETFDGEVPVLTASLDSGVLAIATATTANPSFTVQYYAWLEDVPFSETEGTYTLPVIDTTGRNLPKNGVTPTIRNLMLEETSAGSGKYKIKTVSTLTPIYQTHEYQYVTAPNLSYFNRLYENGHYEMKEIWILKEGKKEDSTDRTDWDVYHPDSTHFTNRSRSVNDQTVLISEGAVIRLVFDTTDSGYTNAVNFYDYDITDDGTHTASHGINSPSNYTGSGSKLAFGNANTDTGLESISWNGNTLNQYNRNGNGYKGCTFGLATYLSGGEIQYAGGVDVPKLFNEGSANGKASYDAGQYSLNFQRVGDTYILSSVGGTGTGGLQYFNHPTCGPTTHTHIWTNNFWPMDGVYGKDPHSGKIGDRKEYTGISGTQKEYPLSDDGIAHNNMFGMTYQVKFTMHEDYVGPLEYYFFGDDDMWVFLDGQLVCDIGGVHSSVGEYVDLWDYIEKGSTGDHCLTFFYTERGLSGSTCYMQFTLPSVSSITPEQNTSLLRVEKKVEGAVDSDEEFHFEIKFTDANGNPLPDDYSYTRYTADGTVVKQDVIIYDGGSFDLKAGEYVIVNYLPYGTKYTITETDVPYYTVRYQIGDGTAEEGYTAQGQIPSGRNAQVLFINTAMPVLPSTGGTGTTLYTMGGILLTAAAILLLYETQKRRREDPASS